MNAYKKLAAEYGITKRDIRKLVNHSSNLSEQALDRYWKCRYFVGRNTRLLCDSAIEAIAEMRDEYGTEA